MKPLLSGLVFDVAGHSLRPIMGLPGSAYIGAAVASHLDAGWPAPSKDAAIVIREGRTLLLTGLSALRAEEYPDQLIDSPALVAWNASGTSVALYSASAAAVQSIRIVAGSIVVDSPKPFYGAGPVQAIAVNTSGDVALGNAEGVYLLGSQSGFIGLSAGPATALAFSGDDILYALSSDSVQEVRIKSLEARPLITGRQLEGICVSQRHKLIWVIDRAGRKAVAFTFTGKEVMGVALEQLPGKFSSINSDSVFLLSGIEQVGQSAMVLSVIADPAVFFVPSALNSL